jgi:hypothetical protein
MNFSGYFDSADWTDPATGIGTWTVQVRGYVGSAITTAPSYTGRGNSGLYNSFNSVTFTIKIINPCISSQVDDITLLPTPENINLETRVSDAATVVSVLRTYFDPSISRNTFPAGTTSNDCGNRLHYVADYDST